MFNSKTTILTSSEKIPIFAAANETPTSTEKTAMNAPLRTYRPPAAGTQYHRCSATTRVAPFAHLHIGQFANFPHHSSPITHNSHHSFSAKERDVETGLSYFGSRYYSADLSVWLSVDPMSGKYPSLSPYVYCADNPVRCVDPNGEEIWIDGYRYAPNTFCPSDASESTQDKWNALNHIYYNNNGSTVIDELVLSNFDLCISSECITDGLGCYQRDGTKSGTIYTNGNDVDVGMLSHELFHSYQHLKGQPGHTIFNEVEANMFSFSITGDWKSFSYDVATAIYKTGQSDPDGQMFNSHLFKLINNPNFDQKEFDYVHDGFQQWSKQNSRGKYNSYDTICSDNTLIQFFFPLR